jgi:hypothetical protein
MTINQLFTNINNNSYDKTKLRRWIEALSKHEPVKDVLMDKVNNSINLEKSEVISWFDGIPNLSLEDDTPKKKGIPSSYKKGDVLMHKIFRHPYVLLEKKSDYWICCLMTTEESCEEILEKANSRFFPESYFTKVLFTISEPVGPYMYPFDNNRQLNKVLDDLRSTMI